MNLEELRKKIDKINEEIISLFARRFQMTKQIAHVKKRQHIPIDDFQREDLQRETLRALAKRYQLSPSVIEDMFALFIDYSKLQMKIDMLEEEGL